MFLSQLMCTMYYRGTFCLGFVSSVLFLGVSFFVSSCSSAQVITGNTVHCRTCANGKYLRSDTCHPCPTECMYCNSSSYCLECRSGYFGDKCQYNCSLCKDSVCSKNACTLGCISGRWGSTCENMCYNCERNACGFNDGICHEGCQNGSYWKHNKCHKCPDGCIACTLESSCKQCTRELWGTTMYCSYSCQISGMCSKGCKDGFYMMPGIYCISCPYWCATCTSLSDCDTCIPGRWGKTCIFNCASECSECFGSSNTQCTKCEDGYTLSGYKCNANQSSVVCPSCITPTNGTRCGNGSFLSGYECLQCPVGCAICSSLSDCTTCSAGYYKPGSACKGDQLCIPVDGICDNGCMDGWKGYTCDKNCDDNCNVCDQFNGTCINCKDGKYGEKCDKTCDKNCIAAYGDDGVATCNKYNGSCNNGCVGNNTGVTCDKDPRIGFGITTSQSEHHVEEETNNTLLFVAVSGGAFILIIAGLIGVCIVLRKGQPSPPRNNDEEMPSSSVAVVYNPLNHDYTNTGNQETPLPTPHRMHYTSVEPEEIEFDKGSDETTVSIDVETPAHSSIYYTNVAGLKRSRIQVDQLQGYVAKKINTEIKDEFQKLPQGLTRLYTDASKPENIEKLRYRSIYPYDVTRVKLRGGDTDFINANYIDGYDEPKAYIASQGPTANTMDDFVDFWRMVWQEEVEKIVMLTNLIEDKKMKCEQYWPNAGTCHSYGDVMVTCHCENTYAEYAVKSLSVSKGSAKRSLRHLHFTAWPDKRVPDNVTSLIEFRQKVESIRAELGGPVIVHCSAGVGRTGTYIMYIALDILTKEGGAEKSVDILGCVIGLRNQRVSMVQTEEQYRFLHDSLVHDLTFDCQLIHSDTFQQYLSKNFEKLVSQFEQINATEERKSIEESNAVKQNSSIHDKNRKDADVPGDRHRPRLYHRRKPGSSDYINATFINSFRSKNRFIVTQTPLPRTVVDFLTLILQGNCSCIVSMDVDLLSDMTVGVYLPAADQTLKHGDYQISCHASESTPHYILRKLTIQRQGVNWSEEKIVNYFQFTCWTEMSPVPNDTLTFIKCIQDVEKTSKEFMDMGPIVIHCLNGAERSGLFCAVSNLIQKMEIEHEVSVVNTVRQIKSRRGCAIPNKHQYIFCHKCVAAFLQTFDKNYSNLSLRD